MSRRLPIAPKANGPMVSRAERGCLSLSDLFAAVIAASFTRRKARYDYLTTFPRGLQPRPGR